MYGVIWVRSCVASHGLCNVGGMSHLIPIRRDEDSGKEVFIPCALFSSSTYRVALHTSTSIFFFRCSAILSVVLLSHVTWNLGFLEAEKV